MVMLTTPKVHMGTLTGGEMRALQAERPVVLLPMGSHEDQGPHAPMGDYLLAEKIAELAALRANGHGTRTLVAPVVPFGGADYFGAMPGGIALGRATLVAVLGDVFACLLRHGFTRLIVVNGHGGNVEPVAEVTRAIYRKDKVTIPSLYLWRIGYALLPQIVGAEKSKLTASHGADPLTSVAMHLFPDLIRADMVPAARPLKRSAVLDIPFTANGTASFEGAEIGMPIEYDEVYTLGVGRGDPRLASAETGAAMVEKLTEITARFVLHYAART